MTSTTINRHNKEFTLTGGDAKKCLAYNIYMLQLYCLRLYIYIYVNNTCTSMIHAAYIRLSNDVLNCLYHYSKKYTLHALNTFSKDPYNLVFLTVRTCILYRHH